MVRADIIYLLSESPEAHGVFDAPTETPQKTYCTVRSVGMREYYEAKAAGIEPEVVFRLADSDDYGGEKVLTWNGRRYRVVRTWMQSDGIDLTCELATNDRAAEPVKEEGGANGG